MTATGNGGEPITYEALTLDQRRAIVTQRLAQLEEEHFTQVLNKRLLVDSGDSEESTEAAIEEVDRVLRVIETAIDSLRRFAEDLS